MTVLRYKSAKYSIERPLHIGAALAGAGAGDDGRADGVRAAARARRSSCATTCSASSATRPPPASRPATTWSRASAPCWSRWPSTPRPATTPRRLDAALGTRARRATRWRELRGVIDASGAHAQVEAVIGELVGPRPRRPRPGSTSTTGRAGSCASSRRPPPTASSDRRQAAAAGSPSVQAREVVDLRGVAGRLRREPPTLSPSPRSSTANGPPRLGVGPAPEHGQRGPERLPSARANGPSRPRAAPCPCCPPPPRRPGSRRGRRGRCRSRRGGRARRPARLRNSAGLVVDPAVEVGEPPAGVLDRVLYVGGLEHRVPPVDARLGLARQEGCQSAHRGSSRTTLVDPVQ